MTTLSESTTLEWLTTPDIALDTPGAERVDYGQVVLERRLRDAISKLNPSLPSSALEDALRKLTHTEGATLEARNRSFHRVLVAGVTVEYRSGDGTIRGEQARVIDFGDWAANEWLAVNQFTVTENRNTRRPDIVLFLNGLPLGIIELKNPDFEEATEGEEIERKERLKTKWAQYVADRLRCAKPAHHVPGQADAGPRADAGHVQSRPLSQRERARVRAVPGVAAMFGVKASPHPNLLPRGEGTLHMP